jgi:hypothetical protein
MPKMMKATKRKQPQQCKMSSKATKAMTQANPKLLLLAMTQANPKFVMGKPMLTVDELCKASQPCVNLHNHYIHNYKMGQDIIVQFKDHHFLVGDDIFIITFFYLYNLFNLDALDIFLMCCFTLLYVSSIYSIYVLYVSNKFGILHVGTCNNKLFIKRESSLLHILT